MNESPKDMCDLERLRASCPHIFCCCRAQKPQLVCLPSSPSHLPLAVIRMIHNNTFCESVVEPTALVIKAAPSRKRVSFATMAMAHDLDAKELVPSSWYGEEEMSNFRDEARVTCRYIRSLVTTNDYSPTAVGPLPTGALEEALFRSEVAATAATLRGLEYRICHERQRRKCLATKCVVRAQVKLNPERLAALAQRCNQWATKLAQEEAMRDVLRAHDPEPQFPAISTTYASVPRRSPVSTRKHMLEPLVCDDMVGRRVRPRVSA